MRRLVLRKVRAIAVGALWGLLLSPWGVGMVQIVKLLRGQP